MPRLFASLICISALMSVHPARAKVPKFESFRGPTPEAVSRLQFAQATPPVSANPPPSYPPAYENETKRLEGNGEEARRRLDDEIKRREEELRRREEELARIEARRRQEEAARREDEIKRREEELRRREEELARIEAKRREQSSDPIAGIEGDYNVSGTNPNGNSYSGTARIWKSGEQYFMSWSIGSQSFSGKGYRNGDTLTIDWGQSSPVIYKIGADGILRGTWSNGNGLEDLRRSASVSTPPPAASSVKPPSVSGEQPSYASDRWVGEFDVQGRNPSGSTYHGKAWVTKQGGTYHVKWLISDGTTYHGSGKESGGRLVINWGQTHPVIYRIDASGNLKGTWAKGTATETLIRK